MGGSSAINGAVAMRLPKANHAQWAEAHDLSALGWQSQAFYRSLERTSGAGGEGHDGPFPIHQLGNGEVSESIGTSLPRPLLPDTKEQRASQPVSPWVSART
ncbi:MAG: GMC family oxidoreductase N-terminal domain-containing protein [Luteimonas sp.]|nr:GMC family oxidoreductase N-terminal domain-containing protein [Luteimonas sp.]